MSPEHDQSVNESYDMERQNSDAQNNDTRLLEKTSSIRPIASSSSAPPPPSAPPTELENLMGDWAYPESSGIGIESRNLVNLTVTIDQEDEDYDNED